MDIDRVKLKVGKDFSQNKAGAEIVQGVFENVCDLKIDVNGAWDRKMAFEHIPLIQKFGVLLAADRILSLLCKDAIYHDESYGELDATQQKYSTALLRKNWHYSGTCLTSPTICIC